MIDPYHNVLLSTPITTRYDRPLSQLFMNDHYNIFETEMARLTNSNQNIFLIHSSLTQRKKGHKGGRKIGKSVGNPTLNLMLGTDSVLGREKVEYK